MAHSERSAEVWARTTSTSSGSPTSSSSSSGGAAAASSSRTTTSTACRRTSRRSVRAMRATGAEVVKVAVMARRLADNVPLLAAAKAETKPFVALAMGDAGIVSRVLAARFGSAWTYAGDGVAPGQIPAARMRGEFSFSQLSDTDQPVRRRRPADHAFAVAGHAQRRVPQRRHRRRVRAVGRGRLRRLPDLCRGHRHRGRQRHRAVQAGGLRERQRIRRDEPEGPVGEHAEAGGWAVARREHGRGGISRAAQGRADAQPARDWFLAPAAPPVRSASRLPASAPR